MGGGRVGGRWLGKEKRLVIYGMGDGSGEGATPLGGSRRLLAGLGFSVNVSMIVALLFIDLSWFRQHV